MNPMELQLLQTCHIKSQQPGSNLAIWFVVILSVSILQRSFCFFVLPFFLSSLFNKKIMHSPLSMYLFGPQALIIFIIFSMVVDFIYLFLFDSICWSAPKTYHLTHGTRKFNTQSHKKCSVPVSSKTNSHQILFSSLYFRFG